jgi:hypothetical protein
MEIKKITYRHPEQGQGKVSVKHFLNTRLKPTIDENGISYFSSYAQVIFRGSNTKIPFDWTGIYEGKFANKFSEKEFDKYVLNAKTEEDRRFVWKVNSLIADIVFYEDKKHKSKFTLKGLGKRIPFYRKCFICDLGNEIKENIRNIFIENLEGKENVNTWEQIEFIGILEILKYLKSKCDYDIFKFSNRDLLEKIISYFILLSFVETRKSASMYYDWILYDAIIELEDYLLKANHARVGSPYEKQIMSLLLELSYEKKDEEDIVQSYEVKYPKLLKKIALDNCKKLTANYFI